MVASQRGMEWFGSPVRSPAVPASVPVAANGVLFGTGPECALMLSDAPLSTRRVASSIALTRVNPVVLMISDWPGWRIVSSRHPSCVTQTFPSVQLIFCLAPVMRSICPWRMAIVIIELATPRNVTCTSTYRMSGRNHRADRQPDSVIKALSRPLSYSYSCQVDIFKIAAEF